MTCRGAVVQCCTAAVITLSPDTGCSAPSCSLLSQGQETHWPGTREHRGVWWPVHWCGGQCTGHQWAREQLTPPLTDASAGCSTALHCTGGRGGGGNIVRLGQGYKIRTHGGHCDEAGVGAHGAGHR